MFGGGYPRPQGPPLGPDGPGRPFVVSEAMYPLSYIYYPGGPSDEAVVYSPRHRQFLVVRPKMRAGPPRAFPGVPSPVSGTLDSAYPLRTQFFPGHHRRPQFPHQPQATPVVLGSAPPAVFRGNLRKMAPVSLNSSQQSFAQRFHGVEGPLSSWSSSGTTAGRDPAISGGPRSGTAVGYRPGGFAPAAPEGNVLAAHRAGLGNVRAATAAAKAVPDRRPVGQDRMVRVHGGGPDQEQRYKVIQKFLPSATLDIHRHIVETDDHAFNEDECDCMRFDVEDHDLGVDANNNDLDDLLRAWDDPPDEGLPSDEVHGGPRQHHHHRHHSYYNLVSVGERRKRWLNQLASDFEAESSNLPKMSPERRRDHLHLLRRRKSRARMLNLEECRKLQHFRKFFATTYGRRQMEFLRHVEHLRREKMTEETFDEEGNRSRGTHHSTAFRSAKPRYKIFLSREKFY